MTNFPLLSLAATVVFSSAMLTSPSFAMGDDEKDLRKGEKVDRICFNRSIDGFSNNEKRSVVLSVSPSRKYLVETGSCFQLRRAQTIGLDSASSCLSRGDRLIVSESLFRNSSGERPDRCYVKAIYEWDPRANDRQEQSDDAAE